MSVPPTRDHSGKQYGAIQVGEFARSVHKKRLYKATWLCCGTEVEISQSRANMLRSQPSNQCAACRDAGRKPMPLPPPPDAVTIPGFGTWYPLGPLGPRWGINVHRGQSSE